MTFYHNNSDRGKHAVEIKLYDKHEKDARYPEGTLRVEVRFTNSASMRHSFDVYAQDSTTGRVLLKDVLNTNKNPVADIFDKLTANVYTPEITSKFQNNTESMLTLAESQSSLINKHKLFKHSLKTVKERNYYLTLKDVDFNLDNVYQEIKPTLRSRVGKEKILEPYALVLNQYNLFEAELTPDFSLLQQLRHQLRNPLTETVNTYEYAN